MNTATIALAPMAGYTDAVFRLLCKRSGCAKTFTEMISAKALVYGNEQTKDLLFAFPEDRPLIVQLFGSEPEFVAKAAAMIDVTRFDGIDINMGCPAPKIVKNGEGSALMRNPELAGRIVEAAVKVTDLPVSVKMRKSFDGGYDAVDLAKVCEEAGAAFVTVHGRTRDQYYSGNADWDIIREVKNAVSIPVYGNGDVVDMDSAIQMQSETGCDGVMIGRAALGNPWIFGKAPDRQERVETALLHCRMMIDLYGEHLGILQMRKHLSFYVKGVASAAKLRVSINTAASYQQIERLFVENILRNEDC